jgi:hypothetical protein
LLGVTWLSLALAVPAAARAQIRTADPAVRGVCRWVLHMWWTQ